MKRLLVLLLIPLFSFGQTYDDIMSINSLDTWKKVVIENDYEYVEWDDDEEDNDWVTYGYKDSNNSSVQTMSAYNVMDGRFSFQIPMRGDNGFGVVRATEMSKIYHSITKKIKANCDYSEIINYKGILKLLFNEEIDNYKLKNYINAFPQDRVCHGDIHFKNLKLSNLTCS